MPYPDAKYPYDQRLVRAAPGLLESCRRLLEIVEAEYEADECPEDLDSWRAAVQLASDAISEAEWRSDGF